MNNLLQSIEKEQIEKLTSKKNIPAFRPGDTLKVIVKIVEGQRSRSQVFEGVCIARKNNSLNSKFTVRKLSHGEGVERVFPLFSPIIEKIEVIRKGDVKRAKLYYLRERTGKLARIADRDRGDEADQYTMSDVNESHSDKVEHDSDLSDTNNANKSSESVDEKIAENNDSLKTEQEKVSEEKQTATEKSESTASEAAKTEDESKSK